MRVTGKKAAIPLLVVTWIVFWLLAIPFFHIHALEVQEIPLSFNSFLAHTVFSGDLPGEYATVVQQQRTSDTQRTVESHYPRYSEFGFVAFDEEDDSAKRGIGFPPVSLDHLEPQQSHFPWTAGKLTFEVATSPPHVSLCSIPSRAPPHTA